MTKWILDTDCYSLIQRGNSQIINRVRQIDPVQIYITIVTVQEQIKGRLNVLKKYLDFGIQLATDHQ